MDSLTPSTLWQAWNVNPLIVIPLELLVWRYWVGWLALRRKAVRGKVHPLRPFSFALGVFALIIALLSPLDALAEQLLSAHMLQHLLLILVAPPLLLLGFTPALMAWSVPERWRRPFARASHRTGVWQGLSTLLRDPLGAWLAYAATLWVWHVPALYEAALNDSAVHAMEHASFFGVALWFWWPLVASGPRVRFSGGEGILYAFTTAIHGSILGALMTLAPVAWYATYSETTLTWGLLPLEDQQIAGLLMWLPGGIVYLCAALLLLGLWLRRMEALDAS